MSFVRLDQTHSLGQECSHALALRSLDLTAYLFAAIVPESVVVDQVESLDAAWAESRVPILALDGSSTRSMPARPTRSHTPGRPPPTRSRPESRSRSRVPSWSCSRARRWGTGWTAKGPHSLASSIPSSPAHHASSRGSLISTSASRRRTRSSYRFDRSRLITLTGAPPRTRIQRARPGSGKR